MCIYPQIEIRESVNPQNGFTVIQFLTKLRKEYNGKYYIQNFYRRLELDPTIDIENHKNKTLLFFNSEVYLYIIAGEYSDKKDNFGNPLFELDLNQETEIERLTKLIMK